MLEGIDISHHQGQPDYDVVKSQKHNFIIHKATEGGTWQDQMYHINRANMPWTLWGAYHVFRPDSPNDTDAEVNNFLRHSLLRPGDLPPFLDLEHRWLVNGPPAYDDIINILYWSDQIMMALGTWPILYISPRGIKELGNYVSYLFHLPLWIADHDQDPTDEIPSAFTWLFWQYTSKGSGKLNGFESDNLCLDRFKSSYIELNKLRI